MKILIPTAKEMNFNLKPCGKCSLSEQTKLIVAGLSRYSIEELSHFYHISWERAEEEHTHLQRLKKGEALTYPALHLFDGFMYRHIKRNNLTEKEIRYVDDHLFITSSLYGILPAMALISPHRLDFLVKYTISGKNLKNYWRQNYDAAIANEELILSLLSSEFETVFSKSIRDKMIRFKFLEDREGRLKVHSTISKKARGQFLTALIENQITTKEEIKQLQFADFAFREDLSTLMNYVFVKK
ncbi:peroxide stress protein YaaA [Streptococcus intermedius]|uniref:peroxide stress protein YaaA n=1 Tax=Streptococcus intermedius TaxID=1338 RepID=UPI000660BAAB|nr:peroxide stress protein YaaA [Streptococcus intermedius]MCI3917383.1 peroxide stress protein YaaA [Streptococcus intermedius]